MAHSSWYTQVERSLKVPCIANEKPNNVFSTIQAWSSDTAIIEMLWLLSAIILWRH